MSSGTVTFQPDGVAIAGKVFTNFGLLTMYIATQVLLGTTDWTILVDGSTGGSPSIQTGAYTLPFRSLL